MKRTTLALAIGLASLSASFADHRDPGMRDLVRSERLSPQDAASVLAIARGLNLDSGYVYNVRQSLRVSGWKLGPAFSISEMTHRTVREVWDDHAHGWSWQDLERSRGRNDDRRDRSWQDDNGRHSTAPRRTDDGYGSGYGNNAPRDRYDYDNSYRTPRNKYSFREDENYERRAWSQILGRAFGREASACADRGLSYADLSLAGQISLVARVNFGDVIDEFDRTRNWDRVRDCFGISADWDRQERRSTYDRRGRDNDRGRLEGLINIVIGKRG